MSTSRAIERYVQRLQRHSRLNEQEADAIRNLPFTRKTFSKEKSLVRVGQPTDSSILVERGLLARTDELKDGKRHLTMLHIPGDMCDLHSVVAPTPGWGIIAMSDVAILSIPHDDLRAIAHAYHGVAMAFWRDTTVDASMLAKWIANFGRRNSTQRVAHLLCELGVRIQRAGIGERDNYDLILTQSQLADFVALTNVHVNRTLATLRTNNLVRFSRGRVRILDWHKLVEFAEYDERYLVCVESR